MSVQTCFVKTKAYLEEKGKKVPTAVLREMAAALEAKRAEHLSPIEFKKAVLEMYAEGIEARAAQTRAARIISLEKANNLIELGTQIVPGQSVYDNLSAIFEGGSRRAGDSLNISTARVKNSLSSEWMRDLHAVLGENLKLAESGLLEREVTQELDHLQRGGSGSASGSEAASKIAKAYNDVMSLIFKVKSAYDPFLGKIGDYFHRASHDRAKIAKAGKEQWIADAMAAYGQKSFPELTMERKVGAFGAVYDSIQSGRYVSMLEGGRSTGGDVMLRMAQSRTLIPNDWASFTEYNLKYGSGNVHTSVLRSIEKAAQDVAVLQKYGARPEDVFNEVIHGAAKKFPDQAEQILLKEKSLRQKFEASIFVSDAPGYTTLAKLQRGTAAIQMLSKGGKTVLRAMPDIVGATATISDTTGAGFGETMASLGAEFIKRFAPGGGAGRAELQDLWLLSHAMMKNLYQDIGGEPAGFMSKLLQFQSVAALIDRYHSSMSAASATVLTRQLARLGESEHGALAKTVQDGLRRYGIKAAEWDLIRQSGHDFEVVEGVPVHTIRVINPEGLSAIPDEAFAKYLRESGKWTKSSAPSAEAITRARTELSASVGAMINDHADIATSTAGQKERNFMYAGTDPNTLQGAALRFAWQFRSSTIKTYDTMQRFRVSNPEYPQGSWTRVGGFMAMSAAFWVLQDTLGTFLMGKTPEDPKTPQYMMKALSGSGALGVYGDALQTEFQDRHGTTDIAFGLMRAAAGPGVSALADVGAVAGAGAWSLFDRHTKFPSNKLGQLVQQNFPLQNIFYSQALLNFYVMNSFREAMGPGFIGNLQRGVTQKPGLLDAKQSYWALPPNESNRWLK